MPIAHSRRLRIALWVALAALLLPATLSMLDLARGDKRALLRLAALTIVAVTLGVALSRQSALDTRVREKEELDRALRASEAKYSGILSIAADAIISVGADQRIIHFNHGAEQIFGWPADEAIGRDLSVLIPERYRRAHPGHMHDFARADVVARRMGERGEIFGLRRDGTEFPAEASISKLDTPAGLLFTVVLRDTTARQRAQANERFLAEAAAQLGRSLHVRATLEAAVDLPVPYLADACLLDVRLDGDAMQRLASTGVRAESAAPLAAIAASPPTADSPWPGLDVIRRRKPLVAAKLDAEWLDANEESSLVPHWLELGATGVSIEPLVSGDRVLGALTLIVTRRQGGGDSDEQARLAAKYAATAAAAIDNARLYEVAQRATRARDEVLGVVSHDLRNPIGAISMCARALETSLSLDAAARLELLTTIQESTAWVNRLIQDLLDVANIERGQLSLDVAAQDPAAIIERANHMFQVEAAEQGITLECAAPEHLPRVKADDARIVQALGNLLRNAIKFTPRGGRITTSATSVPGGVSFAVADTGPGIPAEHLTRIFDRYWQSSAGARTRGSGLGLSIAKGIVEAHGGTISVRSELGTGTTVAFTIPAIKG